MSNEIAIVKNDSCVAAIRECGKCPDLEMWVDTHGEFVIDLPSDAYDALRQLLNNPAVVEHYESLRKPRYENGCTGDPVLVPGSFRATNALDGYMPKSELYRLYSRNPKPEEGDNGEMNITLYTSAAHTVRPDGAIEFLGSGTCEGSVSVTFGDKPFTGRTERNKS